jgi:hypothetical protein
MVAKLEADNDGNPVLMVADATDATCIGIFFCHKTTSFYRPVVLEEQTFGTSPNTADVIFLNHANIKSGSLKMSSTGATSDTAIASNLYTLSIVNGTVTDAATNFSNTGTFYFSYLYEDPNLTGIDQTLGSGMAATLEDQGEIGTLVYDTAKVYTLMGILYCDANGYLTSSDSGGSHIGVVTKVPTAEDPELRFKLNIV